MLDAPPLVRCKPVQPSCDQRLEGLRHLERLDLSGQPVRVALADEDTAVEKHADCLDRVERDSLGTLEDADPKVFRETRQGAVEEYLHRVARQRLEEDGGEVARG